MNSQKSDDEHVVTLLADLNAGVFLQSIDAAVRDVANSVAHTGKGGKVVITLDLKRIGDSRQVECKHGLSFVRPTNRGKVTEDSTSSTPLYVNSKGQLSLFPEQQQERLFGTDRVERSERAPQ